MQFRRKVLTLAVTIALLGVALLSAFPALSDAPLTDKDRFGVAFVGRVWQGKTLVPQSLADYAVAPLKIGWYSNWTYAAIPDQPADDTLDYVHVIGVRDSLWPPDWDQVRNAVTLNQGALWIIGNEPECPNQGNLTPAQYAERYHESYVRIMGWDPTAQIAIGGVVEPTPLRLRWIEAALAAYQTAYGEPMPIDVWNIHMQILHEGTEENPKSGAGVPVGLTPVPGEARDYSYPDCANVRIFKILVNDFRQWMADNGQRNKPLIISEMGVLQPSYLLYPNHEMSEEQRTEMGDRLIEQFMWQTFDWLLNYGRNAEIGYPEDDNRLVQRWLWYSLNDGIYDEQTNPRGFNGSLFDNKTQTLTRFGETFVAFRNQTYRLAIPIISK